MFGIVDAKGSIEVCCTWCLREMAQLEEPLARIELENRFESYFSR